MTAVRNTRIGNGLREPCQHSAAASDECPPLRRPFAEFTRFAAKRYPRLGQTRFLCRAADSRSSAAHRRLSAEGPRKCSSCEVGAQSCHPGALPPFSAVTRRRDLSENLTTFGMGRTGTVPPSRDFFLGWGRQPAQRRLSVRNIRDIPLGESSAAVRLVRRDAAPPQRSGRDGLSDGIGKSGHATCSGRSASMDWMLRTRIPSWCGHGCFFQGETMGERARAQLSDRLRHPAAPPFATCRDFV